MQLLKSRISSLLVVMFTYRSQAQPPPAYLNTDLPAQQRAQDLVRRMTLQEKISQLVNQSRAIPRLKVPAYNWWSEALHGVAADGAAEFPEPITLAASLRRPPEAIHRMATVIGTEGRIKHAASGAPDAAMSSRNELLGSNINIFS